MALNTPVAVELGLGADPTLGPGAITWTDATPWVRAANKTTTTQGRRDGFSQMPPSTFQLLVDNKGGRWVARNLAGPWYGQIRRNIPIRLLADTANYVQQALDTFSRTSANSWAPAADTGQVWANQGLGGSVLGTDFPVSGGFGIHSQPTTNGFRQSNLPLRPNLADVRVNLTVSCPVPTGANLEPGNIALRRLGNLDYYLCRVQVTTAAAVQIIIFRNATATGSTTLLGPVTVPGLTHAAGTPLNIEAECYGSTIRMRIWQGAAKPASYTVSVVDPAPLDQPGHIGVRSGVATGNTNALPVQFSYDQILVEAPPVRFEGRIATLPVSWDPTARDSTVSITAAGILQQMQQGTGPATSAAVRALTSRNHLQPVQYWPMEDPTGSITLTSQVGAAPMTMLGLSLASYTGAPGCAALPRFGATGYATGPIPLVTGNTSWGMRCVLEIDGTPSVDAFLVSWTTTSGITWRLVISAGDAMIMRALDSTGTQIGFTNVTWAAFYNKPWYMVANASQSGADIAYSLQFYDILGNVTYAPITGTLTGRNVGWPVQATAGFGTGNAFTGAVGEIAFFSDQSGGPFSGAFGGWVANTAANRIAGVCADAGIPVSVADDATKVSKLGPQPATNTLGLIQDAATVDGGILSERGFGLYYMARYERYNRPVDLTLNHALKHLSDLKTADDDQTSRNYEVVTRSGGSRGIAFNAAHIALYQDYDEGITLNTLLDTDTVQQAGWRVNIGTVDDIRIPQLTLNFAATPQLLQAWKRCWVGSRIQILNPPPELGVPLLDLHIEGWTETIDPGEGSWTVVLNLTSARPYQVWEVESTVGNLGRIDTDDSTLAGTVAATAALASGTLPVSTLAGSPLWTTASGDWPFNVNVDGERITVTGIGGLVNDTFTRTTSSTWGTADSGQVWASSGGSASDFSTNGTLGVINLSTTVTQRLSVLPVGVGPTLDVYADLMHVAAAPTGSGNVTLTLFACRADANNYVRVQLYCGVGGTASCAVGQVSGGSLVAQDGTFPSIGGTTTPYSVLLRVTPTLLQAWVWIRGTTRPGAPTSTVATGAIPPVGDIAVQAERDAGVTNAAPYFTEFDGITLPQTQLFTVTRGVNGTAIAHNAGAKVSLWQPGVIGL